MIPSNIQELVFWLLTALALGLVGIAAFFLKRLVDKIDHMATSLDSIKDVLSRDISALDKRLVKVETKCTLLESDSGCFHHKRQGD